MEHCARDGAIACPRACSSIQDGAVAYPRNGSTFSTVAESFSALSSHPTQGDPASPLQPAPLSQGMQQGQGSSVSPGRGAAQQHGGGRDEN